MSPRRKKVQHSSKKTVLWAEDDVYLMDDYFSAVRDEGFEVITATTGTDALKLLEEHYTNLAVVVIDVMMDPGEALGEADTRGGYRTGLVVARTIRDKYPGIPIVGVSAVRAPDVIEWFKKYGHGYVTKPAGLSDIVELVKQAASKAKMRRKPKCFIVHGHDQQALYELKDYLQNMLGFDEPIILRNQPSLGRTIVEKFEEESREVDLVFVLLTPDDKTASADDPSDVKRRARQNVIFEMGYFFGKLQRRKGRVLLLHKGDVELPSDISGLVYVDISGGIEQGGESLRRELREWL